MITLSHGFCTIRFARASVSSASLVRSSWLLDYLSPPSYPAPLPRTTPFLMFLIVFSLLVSFAYIRFSLSSVALMASMTPSSSLGLSCLHRQLLSCPCMPHATSHLFVPPPLPPHPIPILAGASHLSRVLRTYRSCNVLETL